MYFSDDGDVLGLRCDNWKVVFMEQRCQVTLQVCTEPFVQATVPKLSICAPIRSRNVTSNSYHDWFQHHDYIIFATQFIASQFAATFKEFPPAQKAASFTIDDDHE